MEHRIKQTSNINPVAMKQICKYVPGRDIAETVPGLAVNIPESMDYNRIKDTSVPSSYNGQSQLEDVGSRIAEPFDVIEYDRAYTRIRKSVRDKKQAQEEKR